MRASAGALSAAMVLGSVTVAPAVKAENVEEKAGYEVNQLLIQKYCEQSGTGKSVGTGESGRWHCES